MKTTVEQEQVYRSFLTAIRSVGISEFKNASIFGSNEVLPAKDEVKMAA